MHRKKGAEVQTMEKIIVRGGNTLTGSVKISGAKNAVLPILAASLLAEQGSSIVEETPKLEDVRIMIKVLASLGANIGHQQETVHIDATQLQTYEAPFEWVKKMRASFLVMGPLLARTGRARIALPGGCAIGTRPLTSI